MVEGITEISVRGYKSLAKECSIEVRPLTILAGPNSSGKSSIMQPLLLMKQTLEESYDTGDLKISGPNVKYTLAEQFLSRLSSKKKAENFSIGIKVDGTKSIVETFRKERRKGIELVDMVYEDEDKKFALHPEMTAEEIIAANPVVGDRWKKIQEIFRKRKQNKLELRVRRNRCFLEIIIFVIEDGGKEEELPLLFPISEAFEKDIRELIHVPALRGNPRRNYDVAAVGTSFPGTFEKYMASIVNEWQRNNDSRLDDLGNSLQMLGLTWKVGSKPVDDTSVEILVGRLQHSTRGGSKDLVSIADVGFGVSQTLPVLVALLVARSGQLVYVEQPEIHLHPRAQIAMSQILTDAANRGVRVVVETHSSLLLLGIQSQVAEGNIDPKNIKLHWFKRRPEDGVTEVISADLDEAGAFGDWPEDFADVELIEQSRYMDAAEQRLRNR